MLPELEGEDRGRGDAWFEEHSIMSLTVPKCCSQIDWKVHREIGRMYFMLQRVTLISNDDPNCWKLAAGDIYWMEVQ